jgi:hypothetical protein
MVHKTSFEIITCRLCSIFPPASGVWEGPSECGDLVRIRPAAVPVRGIGSVQLIPTATTPGWSATDATASSMGWRRLP